MGDTTSSEDVPENKQKSLKFEIIDARMKIFKVGFFSFNEGP